MLGPDRALVTGTIKAKTGSLSGSKLVIPVSGRCYVMASSAAGDPAQLLASVIVVPPKAGKAKLANFGQNDTTTIEIGAQPGAALVLKFLGDKKQGLTAKVTTILDPTGTPIVFANFVKSAGLGGTLTMPLPIGGTWTVVLGATSSTSNPGKLSYGYTIKQPKVATYSAD